MPNNKSAEKIVYPIILISLMAVTVGFAILTIKFVSSNINKAFVINDKLISPDIPINIEAYNLITKKLNIAVEEPQSIEEPQPTEEQQTTGEPQ